MKIPATNVTRLCTNHDVQCVKSKLALQHEATGLRDLQQLSETPVAVDQTALELNPRKCAPGAGRS